MEKKKDSLTGYGKAYIVGIALFALTALTSRVAPGGTLQASFLLAAIVSFAVGTYLLIKDKKDGKS